MSQNRVDFDIMDSCIVDHCVDHDVNRYRPRRPVEQISKRRLEERDVPETQKQIVEV